MPPANDDRLEHLAPHDGTHSGAAVGTVRHRDDRRKPDLLLSGRPHLENLDTRVVEFLFENPIDLVGRLAPQVRGVAQFGFALLDPEVDRLWGDAANDDAVEAGELEFRGPEAAGLAIADRAGERRLGDDGAATLPCDGCAGRPGEHEREGVLRPVRVGAGRGVLQEVVEAEGTATEVGPVALFGWLLDVEGPGREVDMKDLPGEAKHDAVLLGGGEALTITEKAGRRCGGPPSRGRWFG